MLQSNLACMQPRYIPVETLLHMRDSKAVLSANGWLLLLLLTRGKCQKAVCCSGCQAASTRLCKQDANNHSCSIQVVCSAGKVAIDTLLTYGLQDK